MKYVFFSVVCLCVCAIILGLLVISPVLLSFGLVFYFVPKRQKAVIVKKPATLKSFIGEILKSQI